MSGEPTSLTGVSTSYLQFIGTVLIDQDQDGHTHMPFIALVLGGLMKRSVHRRPYKKNGMVT